MANPFMAAMGGANGTQIGPMAMLQQLNQFRQAFQGDPKAEVEKLLASGRIDQSQLNQLQSMARQIQSMLGNG